MPEPARAEKRKQKTAYEISLGLVGSEMCIRDSIGSSPEILVRLRDGVVTIRPIAGTRPRGKTQAEDIAMETDLLADPKECAEPVSYTHLTLPTKA